MDLQVKLFNELITLDNGVQYMELTPEEARIVIRKIEDILYAQQVEENLEKDWNYLGGL